MYEDERLFINMIHRLNQQVMETAEFQGWEPKEAPKRPKVQMANMPATETQTQSQAISSLPSLVEDIDANMLAAQVCKGFAGDGDDSDRDEDGKKAEQFGNGSQKGHFISRTCIETRAKVKTRKCSLSPIHSVFAISVFVHYLLFLGLLESQITEYNFGLFTTFIILLFL